MDPSVLAGWIAGILVPFVQESVFGAKVSGRAAAWLNVALTFISAAIATWVTGGFATATAAPAFDLLNPSAFFGFWWHLWLPVYGISQVLYSVTTSHAGDTRPGSGPIQAVAAKVQPVLRTGNGEGS